MRCLLKITIPTEAGNAGIKDGTLGPKFQSILEDHKPEAVYIYEEGGKRTTIEIVDIQDPSDLPSFVEPWYLGFNADVEIHPAFVPEDMEKVMGTLEEVVKKYG